MEIDRDRLWQLMLEQPSTMPDDLSNTARLVENPSCLAATWRLEWFRDWMRERVEADPLDPDWPKFLACTEAALAWRATVPPDYHFWQCDRRRD